MTSSPGSRPRACSAITSASVPFATPTPCARADACGQVASRPRRTSGPRMKRPESTTSPMRAFTRSATDAHWAEGSINGTDMPLTVSVVPPQRVSCSTRSTTEMPQAVSAREERIGIDLAEPAEEVPLGVVVGRSEDRVARVPRRSLRLIRACAPRAPAPPRIPCPHRYGTAMEAVEHGRVAVEGGQVAYRVFGTGSRALLCLHGGPGCPSSYLDSHRRPGIGRPARRLLRPARLRRLRGARRPVAVDDRALRARGRAGPLGARPRPHRPARPQLRRDARAGVGARAPRPPCGR